MCINPFFAARFETDLRRQWIAAGLLLFSHKKCLSHYLVSSLSFFLGNASGGCLGEVVLFRRRAALYVPPENVS